MFAAVREAWGVWRSDAHGPRRRRARRLAGLFAFEFVVVVLGVLVAQSLQDYASSLRDKSDMAAQRAHADFQIADLRVTSQYWLQLAPCISAQLDRVTTAVAAGETPLAADLAHPDYLWSRLKPWDEKSLATLRRSAGEKAAGHYVSLVEIAAVESDLIWRLAGEWPALTLAAPGAGAMDSADRAAVRLAAARIRGHLTRIISNADSVVRRASNLGIEARTVDPVPALPAGCQSATVDSKRVAA